MILRSFYFVALCHLWKSSLSQVCLTTSTVTTHVYPYSYVKENLGTVVSSSLCCNRCSNDTECVGYSFYIYTDYYSEYNYQTYEYDYSDGYSCELYLKMPAAEPETADSLIETGFLDVCMVKTPCMNGATCTNDYEAQPGYSCTCASGFSGSECEDVIETTPQMQTSGDSTVEPVMATSSNPSTSQPSTTITTEVQPDPVPYNGKPLHIKSVKYFKVQARPAGLTETEEVFCALKHFRLEYDPACEGIEFTDV